MVAYQNTEPYGDTIYVAGRNYSVKWFKQIHEAVAVDGVTERLVMFPVGKSHYLIQIPKQGFQTISQLTLEELKAWCAQHHPEYLKKVVTKRGRLPAITTTLRFPAELYASLIEIAGDEGGSLAQLIIRVLTDFVKSYKKQDR